MGRSSSINARNYTAGLGGREVELLATWERERRILLTLDELRKQIGHRVAKDVARELVRKGVLQRVRRGLYLVRPFRTLLRRSVPSAALATGALLQGQPYYLGGLWAASFHRLTEQRHSNVVDAFVGRRLAPRELGVGRARFHVLRRPLLEYGVAQKELEGLSIRVSDVERTLLDGLDHPRIFGGVWPALERLQHSLAKADHRRLIEYAVRGSRPSTCQRLGAVLERANISPSPLRSLRSKAHQTRSLLSMNPDAPRTGAINRDWNVVENDL